MKHQYFVHSKIVNCGTFYRDFLTIYRDQSAFKFVRNRHMQVPMVSSTSAGRTELDVNVLYTFDRAILLARAAAPAKRGGNMM